MPNRNALADLLMSEAYGPDSRSTADVNALLGLYPAAPRVPWRGEGPEPVPGPADQPQYLELPGMRLPLPDMAARPGHYAFNMARQLPMMMGYTGNDAAVGAGIGRLAERLAATPAGRRLTAGLGASAVEALPSAGHAAAADDRPRQNAGRVIGDPTALALLTGRHWQGANLDKLKKAEELEAQGVHRDEIWNRMLWGRATDGEWLTDTPNPRLNPDVLKMISEGGRTKAPPSADPLFPSITLPDSKVWLNNPTLDMPHGKDATTEFRTEDMPEMVNLLMQRGNELPGSYLDRTVMGTTLEGVSTGRPMGRSLTDVAVGMQRLNHPFQGYDVEALENTLGHELIHKSLYRGSDSPTQHNMPPDPDRYPETRVIPYDVYHDHYLPEALAGTYKNRKHLTPEQQQARPYWYDYPVPERMQIYYNKATDKWHVPPEVLSNPLGRLRLPEDWQKAGERSPGPRSPTR